MVKDAIKHRSGKYWIPHHLRPVHDLFVCGKDNGRCLIGITDKCEEPVGLAAGDRRITDLINDEELCFFQVPQAEASGAFNLCCVKDLHKVDHLFKADSIAVIDGMEPESHCHHGLPEAGWARQNDVAAVIEPGKFLQPVDLCLRNTGLQFLGIEFFKRADIRWKVCC